MPIRMPAGSHLRTEKEPRPALPPNHRPADSIPYKVTDLDTNDGWAGVARRNGVDAQKLIFFNFQTNNSDEVNWYLRNRVGCDLATDDRQNWKFSSSASPGIIYLPVNKLDMKGTVIEGRRTVSPLAAEFEGPSSPLDSIGKMFDVMTILDMVGLMPELGPALGIILPTIGQFVLIGAPHEAALNELRKRQILEGLSLGIVLTADGRSPQWIKSHGFVKYAPVYDVNYPDYGKQLQGMYNSSLVKGILHGRAFNTVATKNLFVWIRGQMTDYAKDEYSGDPQSWSTRKWENYYRLCAAIYQRKLTLN